MHFEANNNHLRYHFDSKTDTPKDMVGVSILKLLRQRPIGVGLLAPVPMTPWGIHTSLSNQNTPFSPRGADEERQTFGEFTTVRFLTG